MPIDRKNAMQLDKYFYAQIKSGKFDGDYKLHVAGNGNGLTNVPKGAKGTITSVKQTLYTIEWENGVIDKFDIAGSFAMDLDIISAPIV